MGGIPTDKDGHVIIDDKGTRLIGFFAAGECACVSVHGANRLGTNSLLEAVVFGRRTGKAALKFAKGPRLPDIKEDDALNSVRGEIDAIFNSPGTKNINDIRDKLRENMMSNCGIFREKEGLEKGLKNVKELKKMYKRVKVTDKGKVFNNELIEALEIDHMLEFSEVILKGALAREESRGAHARRDFPTRDDQNWLKHTLAYLTEDGIELKYKPVTITKYQPEERKY
jgi:succinate dehydrogenase / fumarate reductase flavoprotein subunit